MLFHYKQHSENFSAHLLSISFIPTAGYYSFPEIFSYSYEYQWKNLEKQWTDKEEISFRKHWNSQVKLSPVCTHDVKHYKEENSFLSPHFIKFFITIVYWPVIIFYMISFWIFMAKIFFNFSFLKTYFTLTRLFWKC